VRDLATLASRAILPEWGIMAIFQTIFQAERLEQLPILTERASGALGGITHGLSRVFAAMGS
tara:strand:- start:1349 stop:1534 length:186 start_codon:yes stop_codon:yes gene_type:complete